MKLILKVKIIRIDKINSKKEVSSRIIQLTTGSFLYYKKWTGKTQNNFNQILQT